jgi:threonine/homoserine/homoserine lactone efflux protein
MVPWSTACAFALVAIAIVVTPGPNMLYLVSRSLCQGRAAGMVSLAGIVLGLTTYMLAAAFGITGAVMKFPVAFQLLRVGGAVYLAWLAWGALRPGGASPFELRELPNASPRGLFAKGLLTCLLNPKVAVMYVSLLPQFVDPNRGSVMLQTLTLGAVQIGVATVGNGTFVLGAGALAGALREKPAWARAQRYLMGVVLGALAVRMAFESRP